jgi:putative peptidoglycan lipid II flippase
MSLMKNAIVVGMMTLISRIFGYVRDAAIAFFLGAGALNDVFIIALRLPNLFRTLFGEGAFHAAFIPMFSRYTAGEGGLDKARDFARGVQAMLLVILLIFCTVMIIFMRSVIAVTAPGLENNPELFDVTVELARITFPYIGLMAIAAFYGGMLNSVGKYFVFALAPVFLNIVMIITVYLMDAKTKAHALAYGVVIAGFVEAAWVLYFACRSNLLVKITKPQLTPEVKQLLKRILPGAVGSGITQINILINTIIASYITGAVSYLYYADRISQLPLALVGTAMGTVLLPVLAKQFAGSDPEVAIETQHKAIDFVLFLTIPAAFGIACLAQEIIGVLFEHGNFDSEATQKTAAALIPFAIGLPAFALIKLFVTNFHANGDTKTPVIIAALCIVVNLVISLSFMKVWGHVALALASAVSAWVNVITLVVMALRRGKYRFELTRFMMTLKIMTAAIVMTGVIFGLKPHLSGIGEISRLAIIIAVGGAAYFAVSGATGCLRVILRK